MLTALSCLCGAYTPRLLQLRKTEVAFPRVAFGAFRALIAALSRRPRRHNPLRSAVMRGCPPLASGFKLWSESPTAAGVLRAAEEQHASDAASKKKGALAGGEGEEAEGGASAALADNGGAGAVHEPAAFSKAAAARTLWAAWEDGLSQAERTVSRGGYSCCGAPLTTGRPSPSLSPPPSSGCRPTRRRQQPRRRRCALAVIAYWSTVC